MKTISYKPIVLIEFKDTTYDKDWKQETTDFCSLTIVSIVGYKIQENSECIVLAMTRSVEDMCSERVIIPKATIISITEMETKK